MRVNIRFNTDYPTKSKYAWRVLFDGKQELVNEVRFEIPSFTTSEFIEGLGMKYHLSADAERIEFTDLGGENSLTRTHSGYQTTGLYQPKRIAYIK